mmetsp:Transcript_17320/g.43286  ORF Transcript_17320/g.43286 Transcript_17320/m.43286 type:complete len:790 (+) Transcript_17320:84-2453(+)
MEVAKFLSKGDALVLGTGFATNSTILPALFDAQAGGPGILVLSDALNHRSIVEGVRLSGATVRAFAHNSMSALESELKRAVKDGQPGGTPWRKVFIVVEGIYSMDGDFCRLREVVTLKNRYKAYLYLDEANSIGAVGTTGRGVTELLGVPTSEIEVMMGSFSKSFGGIGGYVAASCEVIDTLRKHAPGSIFASAMSPPLAAHALSALRVLAGAQGGSLGVNKMKSLRDNANFFRTQLIKEGFKVLGDVDSPVILVLLHHPWKMASFSRECFNRGIAVAIVGYPVVPVLYERVRFCISALHTRPQLEQAIKQIAEIGRTVGVLYEKALPATVMSARAAHGAEYAAWLREAPLETATAAPFAEEAQAWRPEPIAPMAVQAHAAISKAALEASKTARSGEQLDLRLFDPLSYMERPAAATQLAIEETIRVFGFGSCSARGFYGSTRSHLDLEAKISEFLGTESTIAYPAGVVTASSVLPALVQPGDLVILDTEAHLGLRTGLRLCKAQVAWVSLENLESVENSLAKGPAQPKRGGRRQRTFLVAEALVQRTGRLAPLRELIRLKEKYGALLILDESLSFGVLGATGRGLHEKDGIEASRIDAVIGSLEHAVAGVGGFCAGPKSLVDHQRLAGSGYCFTCSAPPVCCAAAGATIDDIASGELEGGAARREALQQSCGWLHDELRDAVAEAALPVKLLSCRDSYVQHLRWEGVASEGETKLRQVVEYCKASSASLQVQLCLPGACGPEAAFGAKIGAPPSPAPSLRLCACASLTPGMATLAGTTLREAMQQASA